MERLKTEELQNITGGGKALWFIIGSAASFVAGFITGWFNPKSCNK